MISTDVVLEQDKIQGLRCAYCGRTALDVSNANGLSKGYYAEIFYLTSAKTCACGRCVSENDLVLRLNGEAVLGRYSYTWAVAKGYEKFLLNLPVQRITIPDQTLRFSEVDFGL